MKTVEEVVEEILSASGNSFDLKKLMTELITAYAEERVKDSYTDHITEWAKANADAVTNARAEALEEAAKAVSSAGWNCSDDQVNAKWHTERLAQAIRALKAKP